MNIKLIISFVLINIISAGILGLNIFYYNNKSNIEFKGAVKTKDDEDDHVIEDFFKNHKLRKIVVGDIMKDSIEITKDNVDKDLEHKDKKKSFVRYIMKPEEGETTQSESYIDRVLQYRYIVSKHVPEEENKDHYGDYSLEFDTKLVGVHNKNNLCDQRKFFKETMEFEPENFLQLDDDKRQIKNESKFQPSKENNPNNSLTKDSYKGLTVEFRKESDVL